MLEGGTCLLKIISQSGSKYLGVVSISIGVILLSNSFWYKISGLLLILSGLIQFLIVIRQIKESKRDK